MYTRAQYTLRDLSWGSVSQVLRSIHYIHEKVKRRVTSHVGWLLETETDPWKLSGRFLGSITMVLKNQRLVSMYNHCSQNFEKSINQPYHHQMVLVLFTKDDFESFLKWPELVGSLVFFRNPKLASFWFWNNLQLEPPTSTKTNNITAG